VLGEGKKKEKERDEDLAKLTYSPLQIKGKRKKKGKEEEKRGTPPLDWSTFVSSYRKDEKEKKGGDRARLPQRGGAAVVFSFREGAGDARKVGKRGKRGRERTQPPSRRSHSYLSPSAVEREEERGG